jgi:hypothetical protein
MNQTLELPKVSLDSRPRFLRQSFCLAWNACAAMAVALLFWASTAVAQSSSKDAPPPMVPPSCWGCALRFLLPRSLGPNSHPMAK